MFELVHSGLCVDGYGNLAETERKHGKLRNRLPVVLLDYQFTTQSTWQSASFIFCNRNPKAITTQRQSQQHHNTMETTTTHGKIKRRKRFADPIDILRALPSNIVADIMYPLAIRVIKDRNQLLEAVDCYCEESNHDSGFRRRHPIGLWDVEQVTDFSGVFDAWNRNRTLRNFNEDVSLWNVANATNFSAMFNGCALFNSDVSQWNVTNATNFSYMFCGCKVFNSNLSQWNVTNATTFSYMFNGCALFSSDVSQWNVTNATNFSYMFNGCEVFNSNVSLLNVTNATNFNGMFSGCKLFNSDVSQWNLDSAYCNDMFNGCELFNSRSNVANAVTS
jgi:surface protein